MATIYQSIEILSKEKGIDPQIVLDAVKDAMLVAARKHFRSEEDMAADFDPKTGSISIFRDQDGSRSRGGYGQGNLARRGPQDRPRGRNRHADSYPQADRGSRPYLRANREAGDPAEGPRSRAREYFHRVLRPRRRAGQLHHQARRRSGLGRRPGQDRSSSAEEGAVAPGELLRRRALPLHHQVRRQDRQERGRGRFARRARAGHAPL